MAEPEILVDPPETEPELEVVEGEEPEAPEAEPEAPEPVATPSLSDAPEDEFLKEVGRRYGHLTPPAAAPASAPERPQEDPRMAEVKRLREDYENEKADALLMEISTERAVEESQRQFTERYTLTQQIESRFAGFEGLTPEFKAGIMAEAAKMPLSQLASAIKGGNIEMLAKAHLYDLTLQGKVAPQSPPQAIRTAPATANASDPGIRGRLSEESKKILEAQEKEFGIKYTDAMIKEANLV